MTLKSFAKKIKADFPDLGGCYIAVLENDGGYDLEVEVSEGTIGGVFSTNEMSLVTGRAMADRLDAELTKLGIRVLKTRNQWDGYLESLEMEE